MDSGASDEKGADWNGVDRRRIKYSARNARTHIIIIIITVGYRRKNLWWKKCGHDGGKIREGGWAEVLPIPARTGNPNSR